MFDDCLTGDSKCKVACETCVKDNTVMVAIEVTVAEKSDLDGKGSICQDCEIPFHANQQSGSESGSMHQQRAHQDRQKRREREEKNGRERRRKGGKQCWGGQGKMAERERKGWKG